MKNDLVADLERRVAAVPQFTGESALVSVPADMLQEAIDALKAPPTLPIPDELLNGWDGVSGAIDRIVTALPAQMTAASEDLERERRSFRDLIQRIATRSFRKAST
jgi:hypothetical protein